MKRLFVFSIALLLSLYSFAVYAAEQEDDSENEAIEVTAEGVGAIKGDAADARRAAIDDGLRIAVEQAKGVWVSAETEVESYAAIKDEIATKCKGYVKTYQILNENKDEKEKLYRVRLQAAVLLSNPKEQAPVIFDEQKFTAEIPDVIREALLISKRTNKMAEMINTRGSANLRPEMLNQFPRLRQRYITMLQILKSIEPPKERVDKFRMLKRAIALKARATRLYADILAAGGHRPKELKLANELNDDANKILRELKEKFPHKVSDVKERASHRPHMHRSHIK